MFDAKFFATVDRRPLKEMRRRMANLRPAYINAAPKIVGELTNAWGTQGSSIDAPWEPLRPSWVKKKKSSKILFWQGKLQQSFLGRLQIRVSKSSLLVKLPRSQVKRLAPAVLGSEKYNIPPRELFGWNKRMNDYLVESIIRHIGIEE